jgi:ABC-type multidrug transport system fused ATPase/permease subunit
MPPFGGGGHGHGFHDEKDLGKMYDIKYLRRLWKYAVPYRKLLLFVIVLLLLMACIDLALPIMQKYAMDGSIATGSGTEYDNLIRTYNEDPDSLDPVVKERIEIEHSGRLSLLYVIAMIFFGSIVVSIVFRIVSVLTLEYAGQGIMMDLRMHIFRHLGKLNLTFFDNNPTGRLVTRATNDVQAVYEAFNAVVSSPLFSGPFTGQLSAG